MQTQGLTLDSIVDEILHYLWDPIGLAGSPCTRDEYSSYVPHVTRLLRTGADAQKITHHLLSLEEVNMGLDADQDNAAQVAKRLIAWREALSP